MDFIPKQIEALTLLQDDTTRTLLYGGAAGGGKTVLGCYFLLKMCMKYEGIRCALCRATLKKLKGSTLKTLFEVANMVGLKRDEDFIYKELAGEIHFTNGSEIVLLDLAYQPSDPDFSALGGLEFTFGYIDEANEITEKAFTVLSLRMRYKHRELGIKAKMLLTCNPSKNWIYREFYKPSTDKTMKKGRVFLQALPTDNPFLTEEYIDDIMNAPKADKERYMGKWEQTGDNALISYDSIIDIFTNTAVTNEEGKKYLTCDVARMGSDKAVIALWQGLEVLQISSYDKSKITELHDTIIKMKTTYGVPNSNIIIDEDGVGGGLVDMIHGCKGFLNNSSPLHGENYQNLKTQCYYKLAEYINTNQIYISAELDEKVKSEIIEELEQVRHKDSDTDNKLRIISKTEVKANINRSPDYSDALMQRMMVEVGPKVKYIKNFGIF